MVKVTNTNYYPPEERQDFPQNWQYLNPSLQKSKHKAFCLIKICDFCRFKVNMQSASAVSKYQ
jgi:hypothetical protein